MKAARMSTVVLMCALALLLFAAGFRVMSSVEAAIGNSGLPVICAATPPPGLTYDMSCTVADGTTFTSVPANNYLFVTDAFFSPMMQPTNSWQIILMVRDPAFQGSVDQLLFIGNSNEHTGEHFTAPVLVLKAGQKMQASNSGSSAGNVAVRFTGLLTTNPTYLPLALK